MSGSRAGDIAGYRNAAPFFALLVLLAVPAFWPSYLHPEKVEGDFHVHLHGVAMLLWSAMLIAQPWLIRAGKWKLHRQVGKLSYGLAPLVVASTLLLARYRLTQPYPPEQLYFLYVQLALTGVFAVAYVQAIRHRKSAAVHARYMVCTALTLLDPIVARLLYLWFGIEPPWMQVITYSLVDAILLCLWQRDLRLGARARVFPGMLAAFVLAEVPTFILPGTAAWQAFANAYASLPLP